MVDASLATCRRAVLVEDSLADVYIISEIVRNSRLSLEVDVLADGEQAIEFFASLQQDPGLPRPDVVLLDLNLPRRSGHEVLTWLRSTPTFLDLPVIVVTSSDAEGDRRAAERLGASAYFRKRFSYEEFLTLNDVIAGVLAGEPETEPRPAPLATATASAA
ncbi:MAG: response regulator [Bryobacterales bacterium]|nr:response regulator [Bryobacterales bacterium]